ncbi:MAG: TolB family protein [Solirubrobacteraceae bacterium]
MSTAVGHPEHPTVTNGLRLRGVGGVLRMVSSTTLVFAALAIAPASAGATFPGHNGRIAWAYDSYVPHFNPADGINTLTSTGFQKAERRIVGCVDYAASDRPAGDQPSLYGSSCGAFWHVSWSADGQHLVWANVPYPGNRMNSTPAGREVLVLANKDGSGQTTIAHAGEIDSDPSFSPDGKQLLYVRSVNGGPGQIVTSDLTGSYVRQITTIPGRAPEFSPDGRRILFIKGYSA